MKQTRLTMGRAGKSNNIAGRQPGVGRKGARGSFCQLIRRGSWCLGSVWVACLVATTPKILGSTLPSSLPVGIEKTPTPAKDDLEQLQHLEGYVRDGKFHEVEAPLRSYLKAHPDSARACYDLGYVLFRTHHIRASVEALAKSCSSTSTMPKHTRFWDWTSPCLENTRRPKSRWSKLHV